jgi:hypothetical protein
MNRPKTAAAPRKSLPSRRAHYHRRLETGDFSLEANTDSTPAPGHFYLLRGGAVLLCCDDFASARAAYDDLCREHWELHIGSPVPAVRLASAWGLVGLKPTHPAATAVIRRDGAPADVAKLARLQSRQQDEERERAASRGTWRQ